TESPPDQIEANHILDRNNLERGNYVPNPPGSASIEHVTIPQEMLYPTARAGKPLPFTRSRDTAVRASSSRSVTPGIRPIRWNRVSVSAQHPGPLAGH